MYIYCHNIISRLIDKKHWKPELHFDKKQYKCHKLCRVWSPSWRQLWLGWPWDRSSGSCHSSKGQSSHTAEPLHLQWKLLHSSLKRDCYCCHQCYKSLSCLQSNIYTPHTCTKTRLQNQLILTRSCIYTKQVRMKNYVYQTIFMSTKQQTKVTVKKHLQMAEVFSCIYLFVIHLFCYRENIQNTTNYVQYKILLKNDRSESQQKACRRPPKKKPNSN